MIVLGYNGFTRGASLFGNLYGATDVARNLLIGHDASAALVIDGEVVAAVEEERLSRVKKTSDFPENAINWCLEFAGVELDQVDVVAFPWRFSPSVAERMISQICDTDMTVTAKFDALRRAGEVYAGMLSREAVYGDFVQRTGYELDPNKLALVPHHLAHLMCGAYLAGVRDAAFLVSDGRAETLSSATRYWKTSCGCTRTARTPSPSPGTRRPTTCCSTAYSTATAKSARSSTSESRSRGWPRTWSRPSPRISYGR
jgi:carbamoyltransferase